MTETRSFVATHTYKGSSAIPTAEKKCACGKRTTGRVKNIETGKTKPFCSTCAYAKGFR